MIQPRRVVETYQDLKRASRIAAVLVRYGFGDLLDRLRARYDTAWPRRSLKREAKELERLSTAERLRLSFQELGPTFIKLGQILSTRSDLLPPPFVDELGKLQDRVPPFSFDEAARVVEEGLGKPLSELFRVIAHAPVAAASLAQVHRATTVNGVKVAVKVQRPDIGATIETDIRILYDLARLAEAHLAEARYFQPVRLVDDFARTIRKELDFVREGRNIDRFRKYFGNDPTTYIPAVFWPLTSARVLTTEYIEGVKISDLEGLEAAGLDRKVVAINGANLVLKEIFEYRFFHADPHPGNLFVLAHNVIAPVDFGMMGTVSPEIAERLGEIFMAILDKDIDRLVNVLLAIGVIEELTDERTFKLELQDLLERYYGIPLAHLNLASVINELMEIIRRYKLRLPSDLILLARTLLVSEGVGRMLYPEFNIIEHARPYARRLLLRRFDPSRHLREVWKAAADAFSLAKRLPADVGDLLTKMKKGEIAIRFEHQGLEYLIGEMDRSSNRISFAVVIAALIIGSSLIFQSGVGPALFGYPVIGLAGFLIASLLGLWLLAGIIRSGRV